MKSTPTHPDVEQINLARVLGCLGDPTRLAIVARLAEAENDGRELRCRDLGELGGKSNLSYHFDKLRAAGVIGVRLVGTNRYLSLRRADLERRFPGLLASIVEAAASDGPAGRTRHAAPVA